MEKECANLKQILIRVVVVVFLIITSAILSCVPLARADPGPSADIIVLDPYNEIPVGGTGSFDVKMENTGEASLQDTLWNITLTAVASNNLVQMGADAYVVVYRSNHAQKYPPETVHGTTETVIYARWSTTQSFSAVTWTLPGTFTLAGGEYLIMTIDLHCLGEGTTEIDIFPRSTENHFSTAPIDLGSISDQKNLFIYAGHWYPLHNSYDPYDDPIPDTSPPESNGHSWHQNSWNVRSVDHAYAKGTKTVTQTTPVECTVYFYTDPTSVGSISFQSATYTNGQSHTYAYGTSGLATANVPSGYTFGHWEVTGNVGVSSTTDDPTTFTITCGGTLKAVFSQIQCPVTFYTAPTSGTITFQGDTYTHGASDTFSYGTSDSATPNAPVGYVFDHWETTGNVQVSGNTVTVTCGGTLKAVFKQVPVGPSVGGEWISIDRTRLLVPWVSSTLLMAVTIVSFVCLKRVRKRNT